MNKATTYLLLPFFTASLLLPQRGASAQFGGAKVATVSAASTPTTVARGGKGVLIVTLAIKPTYHVNANHPNDSAYIPTVFTVQPMPGIAFGTIRYPVAKSVKVSYSPKPLLVYMGKAAVEVPFTVTQAAKPGAKMLVGMMAFQGCDAKSCYPPTNVPVKATLTVK